MGLFDGAFNPNLGWLGSAMQQNNGTPADIMNPQIYGDVAGQGSVSNFLRSLFPPLNGGAQSSPFIPPQQTPQDMAQSMPPLDAPRALGPGTVGNGSVPLFGSYRNVPPQSQGPSLDQRAYGSPMGAPSIPPQAQAAMAQAPQPQGGDFLGGLQNFSQNLQNNPGVGGIINALRGAQTGQNYGGSALQKTGSDPLTGQDTFAWVNPMTQTIKPATIGDAGPSQGGPSLGSFSQAVQSGVTGDALYQHLPPQVANTVKSMIDGRAPVPAGAALRSPQGMALMNAANAIDPKFDQTQWAARNALRKSYEGGGKNYQELQAIGTVAGHLQDFAEAADKLDNTAFPIVNQAVNAYRTATGDARVDRFNTVKQAVSNELSKAYRGGQVTEGDVREWQQNVNAAKSPEQLKGVIGKMNELLASKRTAMEEGYRSVMGPNAPLPENFSATNERTKKVFDNIAKWSNGEAAQPAKGGGLPSGTYNWTPQGVSR